MRKKRIRDPKEILVYQVFSWIFTGLSAVAFFLTTLMEQAHPGKNWLIYGLFAFIFLNLIALLLMRLVKADKAYHNLEKEKAFYENKPLTFVDNFSLERLEEGLEKTKFKLLSNNYYFKRDNQDKICLYLKFYDKVLNEESLEKEKVKLDKFFNQNCLAIGGIFIFKVVKIEDEDLAYLEKVAKAAILKELSPIKVKHLSLILMLYSEVEERFIYFEIPETLNVRIYSFASYALRRIFKKMKDKQ